MVWLETSVCRICYHTKDFGLTPLNNCYILRVHPQSSTPYYQIGFMVALQRRHFFSNASSDFLPFNQYKSFIIYISQFVCVWVRWYSPVIRRILWRNIHLCSPKFWILCCSCTMSYVLYRWVLRKIIFDFVQRSGLYDDQGADENLPRQVEQFVQ